MWGWMRGLRFFLGWWCRWQPLLPPSAVLRLTLTLSVSEASVHLLMGPSSLTVSHLDIRQHPGVPGLEVQSRVSEKFSFPRGEGRGRESVLIVISSTFSGLPLIACFCWASSSSSSSSLSSSSLSLWWRKRLMERAHVSRIFCHTAEFYLRLNLLICIN